MSENCFGVGEPSFLDVDARALSMRTSDRMTEGLPRMLGNDREWVIAGTDLNWSYAESKIEWCMVCSWRQRRRRPRLDGREEDSKTTRKIAWERKRWLGSKTCGRFGAMRTSSSANGVEDCLRPAMEACERADPISYTSLSSFMLAA